MSVVKDAPFTASEFEGHVGTNDMILVLNQARAGLFLRIDSVRECLYACVCVFACVCVHPEAMNN